METSGIEPPTSWLQSTSARPLKSLDVLLLLISYGYSGCVAIAAIPYKNERRIVVPRRGE
jgi:hypothetical protein